MNNEFQDGCLSMFGAGEQIPNRGPITTSSSAIDEVGIARALRKLAATVQAAADCRPVDNTYLQALDDLEPAPLSDVALAAITSLPTFAEDSADVRHLSRQLRLLDEMRAGRGSRDAGDAMDACREVVASRATRLHDALGRALHTQPRKLDQIVEDCAQRVSALRRREQGDAARQRAARALQKYNELPQYEDSLLRASYLRVQAELLAIARAAIEEAAAATADDVVWELLQGELSALPRRYQMLRDDADRYTRHSGIIGQHFQEREDETRSRQKTLAGTSTLVLRGPAAERVLAEAVEQSGASSLQEWANELLVQWEAQLRQLASPSANLTDGDEATFAGCLIALPPEAAAAALAEVLYGRLATRQSLYQQIASYGVEAWASRLKELAAPTCFFPEAQHARFGLSPTELAVLRLPRAATTEDETVREQIDAAFAAGDGACHIEAGEPAEQEIVLTRLSTGYIAASDGVAGALLADYQEADEEGHPMHLLGFVPDSVAGRASQGYRNAAKFPFDQPQESHNESNGHG